MDQCQVACELSKIGYNRLGVELDRLEPVVKQESVWRKASLAAWRVIDPDESSRVIGSHGDIHGPLWQFSSINFADIDDLQSRWDQMILTAKQDKGFIFKKLPEHSLAAN